MAPPPTVPAQAQNCHSRPTARHRPAADGVTGCPAGFDPGQREAKRVAAYAIRPKRGCHTAENQGLIRAAAGSFYSLPGMALLQAEGPFEGRRGNSADICHTRADLLRFSSSIAFSLVAKCPPPSR